METQWSRSIAYASLSSLLQGSVQGGGMLTYLKEPCIWVTRGCRIMLLHQSSLVALSFSWSWWWFYTFSEAGRKFSLLSANFSFILLAAQVLFVVLETVFLAVQVLSVLETVLVIKGQINAFIYCFLFSLRGCITNLPRNFFGRLKFLLHITVLQVANLYGLIDLVKMRQFFNIYGLNVRLNCLRIVRFLL